jgi:recombination protein RecT
MTTPSYAIVPASPAEEKLQPFLAKMEPALVKVLPKHFTPDRVITAALMAASKQPDIATCSKESIALAIMKCARLGLDIGEDIHLIPVKGKLEAWPDYKGLMRLAMQGGLVRDMVPYVVYKGDTFSYALGLEEYLKHQPCAAEKRGPLIGAYVIITKRYGVRTFHYMPIEDIETRRKASRSWGPRDYPACPEWYAKKTVIRDWLNRQPKSAKLSEAMSEDDLPPNLDTETGELVSEVAEADPYAPA